MQASGFLHGHRFSLLMGSGAALLILGITGALVALDFSSESRRASDRLDVVGQSLVEAVHEDLRNVGLLLLTSGDDHATESDFQTRLDLISALPFVQSVGHVDDPLHPVPWSPASRLAGRAIGDHLVADAAGVRGHQILYDVWGEDLLLAHIFVDNEETHWDLVVVDMTAALADAIPTALEGALEWTFAPLPQGSDLAAPKGELHREYLILDSDTTWLLEVRWTEDALTAMGVGLNQLGAAAGLAAAVLVGTLTTRWARRGYVEADLNATKSLLEQKDLLLLAVSHQMRTPLTGIIGFLRLALDEAVDDITSAQRTELASLALGQAEQAAEIVEDLLLAARIQDQELVVIEQSVEVGPLISNVFEQTSRPGDVLDIDQSDARAAVVADPLRIRQLFRNILSSGRDEGATRWQVSVVRVDARVEVTVVPNVAIAPRRDRLTADRVAMPDGLASLQTKLDIARKLALLMGGRLRMHLKAQSTEFRLSLRAAGTGDAFDTVPDATPEPTSVSEEHAYG